MSLVSNMREYSRRTQLSVNVPTHDDSNYIYVVNEYIKLGRILYEEEAPEQDVIKQHYIDKLNVI